MGWILRNAELGLLSVSGFKGSILGNVEPGFWPVAAGCGGGSLDWMVVRRALTLVGVRKVGGGLVTGLGAGKAPGSGFMGSIPRNAELGLWSVSGFKGSIPGNVESGFGPGVAGCRCAGSGPRWGAFGERRPGRGSKGRFGETRNRAFAAGAAGCGWCSMRGAPGGALRRSVGSLMQRRPRASHGGGGRGLGRVLDRSMCGWVCAARAAGRRARAVGVAASAVAETAAGPPIHEPLRSRSLLKGRGDQI